MEELTVLLFAIFIACLLFYLVFSGVQSYQSVKELQGAKRVLIITSHPDDEVMFFGPTILGLVRRCEVFLLCMSPGQIFDLQASSSDYHLVFDCREGGRSHKETRAL